MKPISVQPEVGFLHLALSSMMRKLQILWSLLLCTQLSGQTVSNDSTIVLNQVTVIDGEDPMKILWREMRATHLGLKNDMPTHLKLYMREVHDSVRTKFEQVSTVFFESDVTFQQVEAFKDYSKRPVDFGNTASVQVGLSVDLTPDTDFSEGTPRGDFGRYPLADVRKSWWTPLDKQEFTPYLVRPVVGLLQFGGWTNYELSILETMLFEGEEFITVGFKPRAGKEGWSGTVQVVGSQRRIKSIEVENDGVKVLQEFSDGADYYWTKSVIELGRRRDWIEMNVISVNPPVAEKADRKKLMVAYIPESTDLKEDYWEAYRPSSETLDEWTRKQDSIIRYLNSDEYLDSADAVYNKFHWYEPLVSGVGYRKRSKGTQYFLSPLIAQWNTLGIGGVRWMPMVMASKRFNNYQSISATANVNYGFRNQDLKGSLSGSYIYAPMHNGSVSFSVGDEYDQITQAVDLGGIFARSNFIRKTFVEGYHRYEWFNGFYTRIGLEYSKRESIDSLQLEPAWSAIFGDRNEPLPFETYTVAQLGVEILIRPYQRYYLKGRRKIILSSKWPDFRFIFKQGIPDFLGSDVRFSKYEFLVEDMLRFGPLGESFYRLSSGGFLNDPSTVRFIEHKWFRGGDYLLFTQPLYTYQALPQTFASPGVYFTAAAIHHFDGFFLNKIPLVRRMRLGTAVGATGLMVPQENTYHFESYLGLERKVKLWDTPTRFGAYYMFSPNTMDAGFRFKIGVDVKDTFRDRWNF